MCQATKYHCPFCWVTKHNIESFFVPGRIIGTLDWHDQIGYALHHCNWFILVLSPDAVKSVWVSRELKYALNEARFRHRIIPLMYRSCRPEELSWTLNQLNVIDFRRDFHAGCKRLLSVWQISYHE